jgi:hypothetical protein
MAKCADSIRVSILGALMIVEENEEFAVELLVRAHKRTTCAVEII